MLKLKLQYFGHLMQRADSLEKDPDAGKGGEQEEKGATEGITDSVGTSLSKLWEMVKDREPWHAAAHRVSKIRTQLNH